MGYFRQCNNGHHVYLYVCMVFVLWCRWGFSGAGVGVSEEEQERDEGTKTIKWELWYHPKNNDVDKIVKKDIIQKSHVTVSA